METPHPDTTGSQEDARENRRADWELHHALITELVDLYINEHKRMPTYAEMAEHTKLSLATVKRHIKELKNDRERFDKFKAMTESVVIGMAKAGRRGDAKAAKLFFQFVEGWIEEKRVNQVNVNPYAGQSREDLQKRLTERLAKLKLKEGPNAPPAG